MTNDELLIKIAGFTCCSGVHEVALKAIIELHKPKLIPDWVSTEEQLMCWCAQVYPCPTIQTIEKELE